MFTLLVILPIWTLVAFFVGVGVAYAIRLRQTDGRHPKDSRPRDGME